MKECAQCYNEYMAYEGKADENGTWYCNQCWQSYVPPPSQTKEENTKQGPNVVFRDEKAGNELRQQMELMEIDKEDAKMVESKFEKQSKKIIENAIALDLFDRVSVPMAGNGTVEYLGTIDGKNSNEKYAGIYLDEQKGKNDGSVNGKSYFACPPGFGIFAPINKISQLPDVCVIYCICQNLFAKTFFSFLAKKCLIDLCLFNCVTN